MTYFKVHKLILLICLLTSFGFGDQKLKGVFTYTDGRVEVMEEDKIKWEPVLVPQDIRHNDKVRTYSGSMAVMVFQDSSVITMDEHSGFLYNNALHAGIGKVDRSFNNVFGSVVFNIRHESESFSYNWLFIKGVKVTIDLGKVKVVSPLHSDTLEVAVFSGSAWVEGGKLQKQLLFKGQRLRVNLINGETKLLGLTEDKDLPVHKSKILEVKDSLQENLALDLSQKTLRIDPFIKKGRLIEKLPNWDFQNSLLMFLKDSLSLLSKKVVMEEKDDLAPDYILTPRIKKFDFFDYKDNFTIDVAITLDITDTKSGVSFRKLEFVKALSGEVGDINNLELFAHLPIDLHNKKIRNSLFFEMYVDLWEFLRKKIRDPFDGDP